MPDEIDLTEEQETALDRAWEKLSAGKAGAGAVSQDLRDLLETTHYIAPGWMGLDKTPEKDGKPGWDTEASAADPDEDE